MGRNWGHNHVKEEDVPKGLPLRYPFPWYHYVKHKLRKRQPPFLLWFKEHGKDLYGLNVDLKAEIENIVGARIEPKKSGR